MLSIAIYTEHNEHADELKSIIQEFLIEIHAVAKVSYFNDPTALMTAPGSYCIYLLDLDSQLDILDLGRTMKEINPSAQYVYISQDETKARAAIKNKANYFLVKPIDKQELIQALIEMRQIIQQDSIVIKISTGERRLRISQLNYINIVKRCLCYHLTDGNVFDG